MGALNGDRFGHGESWPVRLRTSAHPAPTPEAPPFLALPLRLGPLAPWRFPLPWPFSLSLPTPPHLSPQAVSNLITFETFSTSES